VRERLALALAARAGVSGKTAAQLRKEERTALVAALTEYELEVTSDLGYKQAEVTGGGVPLTEVDPRTGESRVGWIFTFFGFFVCAGVCLFGLRLLCVGSHHNHLSQTNQKHPPPNHPK
jgi:hypothetical protein